MKIDTKTMEFIYQTAKKAREFGIDIIAFEEGMVKARDDSTSILVIQTENVPSFPFDILGIGRIGTFVARYEMLDPGTSKFEASTKEIEGKEVVINLNMKSKGVSTDFRCSADVLNAKIPKHTKDIASYHVRYSQDDIERVLRGISSTTPEQITMVGGKELNIEMFDSSNDIMKVTLSTEVAKNNSDVSDTFVNRYDTKPFVNLLKKADKYVDVGERGFLYFHQDSLKICLLPRV